MRAALLFGMTPQQLANNPLTYAVGAVALIAALSLQQRPVTRTIVQQRPLPTCMVPFQMASGELRLLVPCDYVPATAAKKAASLEIKPTSVKTYHDRLPREPDAVTDAARKIDQQKIRRATK